MNFLRLNTFVASLGVLSFAALAAAAWNFDAATGTGFVGKGDVQLIYGWNNKQLQDNADAVAFRTNNTVVTEVSWECTNSKNEKVQERERTTTTSTLGLVDTIARVRNQITGFYLEGYAGTVETTTSADGPAINSCPDESGNWSLTTPAGDPVVVSTTGGGLQVSIDGATWTPVPEPVVVP